MRPLGLLLLLDIARLAVALSVQSAPVIDDLRRLSTKQALAAVCGQASEMAGHTYTNVDVVKSSPTVCKFVIGNPKALYENPLIAKSVGLDFAALDPAMPLSSLAAMLPVLYIADNHPEYGTLGFMLNKPTGQSLNDIKPEYKALRSRPVYLGGVQNRGNSFTMMHSKAGFPENRPFKGLPGDPLSMRLFFSPDVAMANELCLTNDAAASDFKFFTWATVWLPKQLDLEYEKKAWLTLQAPMQAVFDDDSKAFPLWRRLAASLPPSRLGPAPSSQ